MEHQAGGVLRARRGARPATRSSPRTPRRCRSPRWARRRSRPDKVVGFHFFYPASVMRLIEVIEGDDTSPETAQAAASFAQAIRKLPIRCAEAPGFVVNRILNSSVSELWRVQEETGIDVKEIDRIVAESKAAPMGPFFLADLLGLDTVLHVAEHLQRVATAIASSSTSGCRSWSQPATSAPRPERVSMSTGAEHRARRAAAGRPLHAQGARRELPRARGGDRVDAGHRPRDDGRRRDHPAAVRPRRPDRASTRCSPRLERAAREWGENFEPPTILRRLVAQGRLGVKTRPGLLPVRAARRRLGREPGEARDARRDRDRVARPARRRTRSRRRSCRRWRRCGRRSPRRGTSARWSSPRPTRCCSAPAPTSRRSRRWTRPRGRELLDPMHALLRGDGDLVGRRRSRPSTRSRSAEGASSRWRATSGSPPSRRRSASPRSTSGSSPGSAARSGCRG